jgi:hypothetical protein
MHIWRCEKGRRKGKQRDTKGAGASNATIVTEAPNEAAGR